MGFSAKQVLALRRPPQNRYIRTRLANGRELSYLEGWYAISEANRIFGFDGWSRESLETRCVLARENRGTPMSMSYERLGSRMDSNCIASKFKRPAVPLCV
jgi:recombination DNA repair RAD52 pathway protein